MFENSFAEAGARVTQLSLLHTALLHMNRGRGYKLSSCSAHEILNAHKYKKGRNSAFFSGSDKLRMLFFLLINVKMPTIVGILTFMMRKNIMFS